MADQPLQRRLAFQLTPSLGVSSYSLHQVVNSIITRNDQTLQGPTMTTDKRAIYSGRQIYQYFDSLTLPDALAACGCL